MTIEETAMKLEEKVIAEHAAAVGKVLLAHCVTGYIGDTDEQIDAWFDPPIRVRVEPMLPEQGLLNWTDEEWLDPYWDVEVIDTTHPNLPPVGLRSCWVYGTSYNAATGEIQESHEWRFAE